MTKYNEGDFVKFKGRKHVVLIAEIEGGCTIAMIGTNLIIDDMTDSLLEDWIEPDKFYCPPPLGDQCAICVDRWDKAGPPCNRCVLSGLHSTQLEAIEVKA